MKAKCSLSFGHDIYWHKMTSRWFVFLTSEIPRNWQLNDRERLRDSLNSSCLLLTLYVDIETRVLVVKVGSIPGELETVNRPRPEHPKTAECDCPINGHTLHDGLREYYAARYASVQCGRADVAPSIKLKGFCPLLLSACSLLSHEGAFLFEISSAGRRARLGQSRLFRLLGTFNAHHYSPLRYTTIYPSTCSRVSKDCLIQPDWQTWGPR